MKNRKRTTNAEAASSNRERERDRELERARECVCVWNGLLISETEKKLRSEYIGMAGRARLFFVQAINQANRWREIVPIFLFFGYFEFQRQKSKFSYFPERKE